METITPCFPLPPPGAYLLETVAFLPFCYFFIVFILLALALSHGGLICWLPDCPPSSEVTLVAVTPLYFLLPLPPPSSHQTSVFFSLPRFMCILCFEAKTHLSMKSWLLLGDLCLRPQSFYSCEHHGLCLGCPVVTTVMSFLLLLSWLEAVVPGPHSSFSVYCLVLLGTSSRNFTRNGVWDVICVSLYLKIFDWLLSRE